ncbi:MAG: DUF2165 family protein [Rubrivivax sp.]|nr:MAG: DUF2165 family protein [Rubrivivax sp.]
MTGYLLCKVVLSAGLALWFLVNVLNHLQDWNGPLTFVQSFLRMSSLDEEPAIPTPLQSRQVRDERFAWAGLILITISQSMIGLAYGAAAILFAARQSQAPTVALIACAGSAALWLTFLVVGAWFAYWLKLGELQRMHVLLLGIALISMLVLGA